MPDAPGFDEMPIYDMRAAPAPDRRPGQASVREAARRRRLRTRFLRAGREAVDDRELLELLLSGCHGANDAGDLAGLLLDTFGTAPRALAARPDRLRTVPGLSEGAIAALKAAEALGIRMAREEVPETVRPSLGSYDKVIEYCRTLAGHREVEEFRILYLNRKNRLIADECLQKGSVCHAPVYPREVCVRCLELQASAIVAVHNHPSHCPEPSRADIEMTKRIEDALRTIEVTLLDHLIVTPTGSVSFQARGLL
ncbi:MAG: DNA repair protein RadC [Defluviicoccus sp.]|nr:DNA repair protein RadC [Defluviicoccus sp.]